MSFLLTNGKFQASYPDATGKLAPLIGGKLFSYVEGSTTLKPTYADEARTLPNTNPVILDGRGEARVWLGSGTYRFLLQTSAGVQIWDESGFADSDAASLLEDLANFNDPGKGAALVGYSESADYPANTVGRAVQKQSGPVNLRLAGAKGDGITNNLDVVNSVLASPHREVFAPEGTYLVGTDPTNLYGPTIGPGILVKPTTGGVQQISTYSDRYGTQHIGRENLYRVYERLRSGGLPVTTYIYGDSTVAGGFVSDSSLEIVPLLTTLAARSGLRMPLSITNRGVSGTSVDNLNALPDLGVATDLLIIKYGINDGAKPDSTRLYQFASVLDARLSAIRSATYGSVTQLAILLVGPNSTSDTPNGRDERWYEQLRGVFVAAAHKYDCAYYDTYAALQESRWSAGADMDNSFGDGRAVHPTDVRQVQIWGGIFSWVFDQAICSAWRTNHFLNPPYAAFIGPSVSNSPADYSLGESIYRATSAAPGNWPENGAVYTRRSADSVVIQELATFAPGRTIIMRRSAVVTAGTPTGWTPWTGEKVALSLLNSWVAFGSTTDSPTAVLDDSGMVTVSANVKSGTVTTGTVVAQLPVGMRPAGVVGPFPVWLSGGSFSAVEVDSFGNITAKSALNATQTSIQLRFRAL